MQPRRRLAAALAAAAVLTLAGALAPVATAAACPEDRPEVDVAVETVPVIPGARLVIGGKDVVTDGAGRASVRTCRLTTARDIEGPTDPVQLPGARRAVFDRVFLTSRGARVSVAFEMESEVSFAFAGLPSRQIERFTLRSSTGDVISRTSLDPVYLRSIRVLRGPDGLEERRIYYSVDSVEVAGSSVVNRSQVKFYPADRAVVRVPLLAFEVRVEVVDRLFRWPTGSSVRLVREGELDLELPLGERGALFTEVPRGTYDVVADAPGLRIDRRLILSRDQVVVMPVLTWLDLAVLIGVPLLIAVGLILAPRPLLRRRIVRVLRRGAGFLRGLVAFRRRRPVPRHSGSP
ncbi:hypothetical protein [uncultured Phycicoccus sp.]|uniref:hypothetical protein n=1 Tax=uncultured Phycicoccus sp. TaxID=661422 RepID=UPI00261E1DC1|nr:hypothetical protein [uncultured Phycicoccus sp.]